MNLQSAIMMLPVLLALVAIPSHSIPKWVWIPDDPSSGSFENATLREDGPEQPPPPLLRARPLKVKVRDENNWNFNQQTQNVILHKHVHQIEGGYGGYRPQGENWEEDAHKAEGRQNYRDVMRCADSSCQTFIKENNDVCRKEFKSTVHKYWDWYNDYFGNNDKNRCPFGYQSKYICCKPLAYCKFTPCMDDKYTGIQICNYHHLGYEYTGHYSRATCGSGFSAYCCKPGFGVPTNGLG